MIGASGGLEAVVFDFDGIILDSETPEFEAHRRIFEQHGLALGADEWCDQIGLWVDGHAGRWFARLSAQSATPPDFAAFEAEKRRLFDELVPGAPMAGIVALIDALDAAGVPSAIASTSPARWVGPAAERLGIARRMRVIITADDVRRGKPAPDVYIEATRRLGAAPARCVAIEDSLPGLSSARSAGLRTIVIPHWLTERHDLAVADLRASSASEISLDVLQALVERSV